MFPIPLVKMMENLDDDIKALCLPLLTTNCCPGDERGRGRGSGHLLRLGDDRSLSGHCLVQRLGRNERYLWPTTLAARAVPFLLCGYFLLGKGILHHSKQAQGPLWDCEGIYNCLPCLLPFSGRVKIIYVSQVFVFPKILVQAAL